MGYDIIGDVHGHASKLTALLGRLGYRHRLGAWRHPDRSAIFVGDLIDRGKGQCETIRIAREMLDAGTAQAVMGNLCRCYPVGDLRSQCGVDLCQL